MKPPFPRSYIYKQLALSTILPFIFYHAGAWLDKQEDLRMTRFRDKSALYGRELAPGEPPSWPIN